jgi:hypothetical protein
MEDVAGAVCMVLFVAVCIFAAIGGGLLMNDVRPFKNIVTVCSERGYIQDNTTRVYCYLEEVKK